MIRRALVSFLIASMAMVLPAIAGHDDASELQAFHAALFDTWFPVDSLPMDAPVREEARKLSALLWTRASASPRVTSGWIALNRALKPTGFNTRSLAVRESLVVAVLRSRDPRLRQAAMGIRLLYLTSIYGSPLGRRIAGLAEPSREPSASRWPPLPPTWIRYDRMAGALRAARGKIDDIVVGSGPAGSVIASELHRAGHRVLLIEQGPLVAPRSMITQSLPRLLESGGGRASVSGSVLFNNAETVGGGSAVNIDLVFSPTRPTIAHQIERWRRLGRIDSKQYAADELRMADSWVREHIGIRTPDESEINRNNRVLWEGARRAGWHASLYDLATDPPGPRPSENPGSGKRSSVATLLLPAMQDSTNPLALLPDAQVVRVMVDEDRSRRRARGVEVLMREPWKTDGVVADPLGLGVPPGTVLQVEAERVILCAGTLGSATVLLRTGLPDPDIGLGIVAHPAVPVIGEFPDTVDAFRGTPASVFIDDHAISDRFLLEAMHAGPEYAAAMVPGTGRGIFAAVSRYRHLAGFGAMLIDESSTSNRIRLDPNGAPEVVYDLTAIDRARLARAIESAARLMFLAGARVVHVPSYEVGFGSAAARQGLVLTDSSQVRGLARRLHLTSCSTIITSAHLQASNRMGTRPAGSVVDTHHRVWDVDDLFVVDASVFPTSVGANPMQTVYVFAKLFVDDLLRADAATSDGASSGSRP